MGRRTRTLLSQARAKSTSNGTAGSAQAANFDRNPRKLTEEIGEPEPHFALPVSGETDLESEAGIRRGR